MKSYKSSRNSLGNVGANYSNLGPWGQPR